MTISVVTSCSAKGFDEYGRSFVETFAQHWPSEVKLYLVSEDVLPQCSGAQFLHLDLSEPAVEFLMRNDTPLANGRQRRDGQSGWTPKKIADGYNFRYDAFRFAKKVFAIDLVARRFATGGRLFWVDADVVTFAPVGIDRLERLLPGHVALSCLDRGSYHSECGFVGYNLDHPQCRPFITAFAQLFASDAVFGLQQWHDSWVFDWLRRQMNVPTHAIPHHSRHHPFVNSEIGQVCDHRKGARKQHGTRRHELVVNRDIPYWQAQPQ